MRRVGSSESDTEESLEELDLNNGFLARTDPRDITELSPELKTIFDAQAEKYTKIKRTDPEQLQYGTQDIWAVQYAVANTFVRTKGVTTFYAAPGFGKTLTGIAISQSSLVEVCLILVPNSVLSQWINAAKAYGLYDVRKPEDSPILVYSTKTASSHRAYLGSSVQTLKKRETLVVIAPHINIPEVMRSVFTKEIIGDREFTVIIDEAHKVIRDMGPWIQTQVASGLITRELLMSGSILTENILKKNNVTRVDHTIAVTKTNDMPLDIWNIKLMDTTSYIHDDMEWTDEVKKIAKQSTSVVIVCELDARAIFLESDIFGRKNIYEYKGQMNTLNKFNEDDDAVLFLSKMQTTGLNINAEFMIILNPGEATTEMLVQLSKRIIRPDNPFREVYLYMLCGTDKEYYRVLYAKAFSLLEWQFGRQSTVNISMVYKGISSIRLLGLDHETLDRVDLCVFLADYLELQMTGVLSDPYEQILEWWEKNKLPTTVLTPTIIRNIIFI
ncbi:Hypothetical protein POVR2_LOCUS250 [uncultured virus]|nr:Hypothetical protein POVR2_LOCUS250 [uncultured virus]